MPNEGYSLYTYMYLKHMLHFRVLVEVVGHLELQVGEIHLPVTCYECKISLKLPTINQTDWFSVWWINWLTTAFNCDKCISVTLNNICYSKNHNDAIHFLFVIGLFFLSLFMEFPLTVIHPNRPFATVGHMTDNFQTFCFSYMNFRIGKSMI